MMAPLFVAITTILILIGQSLGHSCNDKYKRYSPNHSICLPKNSSCHIIPSKMTDEMKKEILDYHNRYRSYIAQGLETRGKGMPPAANMLQMVWDDELAAIIQKFLEQCRSEYDCAECRQVENFFVGQFILGQRYSTPTPPEAPNFFGTVKHLHDKSILYDEAGLDSYENPNELSPQNYRGFTQLIWAKTWRIGCGYVIIKARESYEVYTGCNYGPAGNVPGESVYKRGDACSYCPEKSCCGDKSCSPYKGLCKLDDNNKAPIYPVPEDALLYCHFKDVWNHCGRGFKGHGWKFFEKALGGSYAEVVLKGGEKSTMELHYTIKPTDIVNGYCFLIQYRSGPNLAGEAFNNEIVVSFKSNNVEDSVTLPKGINENNFGHDYNEHRIHRQYRREVRASITFSVPSSANAQYINVRLIHIFNGPCY